MARPNATYRGARRNACRGHKGLVGLRRHWPEDGVQLDPVHHQPTKQYVFQPTGGTTADMLKRGARWLFSFKGKADAEAA